MGLQPPDNWKEPEPFNWDNFESGLKDYAQKVLALNRERAESIVSAVRLEELLEDVLINFLVEDGLSKRLVEDIVGNFGAKIKLAFCLGLISSDETNDLDVIRKVRNHFAHSKECSFNDQKVIDLCKNFRIPKQRPDLFDNYSSLEAFESVSFVLIQNLVSRNWDGKKRKCTLPNEIDSRSWEGFW